MNDVPRGGIISDEVARRVLAAIKDKATEVILPLSHVGELQFGRCPRCKALKHREDFCDCQLSERFLNDPIIKSVIDVMFSQFKKGVDEYGKPLSACGDNEYDWRLMIIEEMVDVMKYQAMEIRRLERLLNP
ncbi:hypothetical protein [Paenibacillus alginolyticus]|uniref:hypothetical protein n=1 Tax=Paenibacillus alginolyticus TaxID=59839 RepID=UPI0015664A71|nr:hypothetical protein [Paenibacillus frigoriresistens]